MIESKFRLNLTRNLKYQNAYTLALDGEYRDFAYSEERAPLHKGLWRKDVFQVEDHSAMDLEIGTGNGTHFQSHCLRNKDRSLLGLEIKYKPLIQTIRSVIRAGSKNGRIARFHAFDLEMIFEPEELNDVFIHFPDPWVTPRKPKNRFVQKKYLDMLWQMQRAGSKIDFKTDSREYFLWSMEQIRQTSYKVEFETLDLHRSEMVKENFVTTFEKIFLRQSIEINFVRLRK